MSLVSLSRCKAVLGGALAAVGAAVAPAAASHAAPPGYTLFWSDEFNQNVNAAPNPAVWNYDLGAGGWGNNEWQTYVNSRANCHVIADASATDGKALQIEAQRDVAGKYYSARINTRDRIIPQYGYIEARLRLPWSQGMWPAFWMLGNNIGAVSWPACGELDIMEMIGRFPHTAFGSLHATDWHVSAAYDNPQNEWFRDRYHLFQASWTPNCITLYVDGVPYSTRTVNETANWPFNSPMFFVLNMAVGGDWPGSPDASTVVPMDYVVDYVRVYRLAAVPSNQIVSLFSQTNNRFVSAEDYGNLPLVANRTVADGWEKFQVVDLGKDNVALLSQANNKYLTTGSGGASPLVASRASIGVSETFHWEARPDGTVSLKSLANNKYVCADQNLANPPQLIASRATAGAWESFGVTTYATAPAPPGAPATPTGLAAWHGIGSEKLSWSRVPGATAYTVYRSTVPGGDGMVAIARNVRPPSLINSGLTKGVKYYYTVTAQNAQGMSARSNVIAVTAR